MSAYSEKLKDPRWQKRRLEILSDAEWACQQCFDSESTLHVHHRWYEGEPWDAPDEALVTLCETCHAEEESQRKASEQRLLRALRRHFLAGEVGRLAVAFETMPMLHEPDVLAAAISYVITNKDEQIGALDRYFESLPHRVRNVP